MVTNFEDKTAELTVFEKDTILPLVLKAWSIKKEDEYVNMSSMIKGINDYCIKYNVRTDKNRLYKATGPRMRKIIQHIRVKGLINFIVADSKGYYLTTDKEKVSKFIKSCKERANSFRLTAQSMEVHSGQ